MEEIKIIKNEINQENTNEEKDKNDGKTFTLRATPQVKEKFKKLAKETGIKQNDLFDRLIETFELSNSKNMLVDREKEIQSIENHLSAIQKIYITSLEINKTCEDTIKDDFVKQLNSKDTIIVDLQAKNKNLKEQIVELKHLEITNKELTNKISDIENKLGKKEEELNVFTENNKNLNAIITDYKKNEDNIKILAQEVKQLSDIKNSNILEIKDLNNKLENKINEIDNIKEFYNKEVRRIQSEYRENIDLIDIKHSKEIKELKDTNKIDIKELDENYKTSIRNLKNENKKQRDKLNTNHIKEINNLKDKHTKEIDKLKIELKSLKEYKKEQDKLIKTK